MATRNENISGLLIFISQVNILVGMLSFKDKECDWQERCAGGCCRAGSAHLLCPATWWSQWESPTGWSSCGRALGRWCIRCRQCCCALVWSLQMERRTDWGSADRKQLLFPNIWRVGTHRNVSWAAPRSRFWTHWDKRKQNECTANMFYISWHWEQTHTHTHTGMNELTQRNSPWTCWGPLKPAAAASGGTLTCSDIWNRSVNKPNKTHEVKINQQQQHLNKNTTEFLNISPHLDIVFDTSDSTTSTSGDLWIWSGWLSPLVRENLLFPFWAATTNIKELRMMQYYHLNWEKVCSKSASATNNHRYKQLPRVKRHNLARKLESRDNCSCVHDLL